MDPQTPTIIVTGSSGMIGTAVVHRFAPQYRVIGFDRPGPPHPPDAAFCIDLDLGSDDAVRDALAEVRRDFGTRIAAVVHLAAYYDFSGEPSDLYEKVTVQGTRRLLEGMHDFELEQFLFSSTMLVHQPCLPGERINEDWPLEGEWDYPQSKIRTEQLLHERRGDIPIAILRIAGVYTDFCDSIPIAHQIRRIYERSLKSHLFPGNYHCGQSFVHLEDVVESIWLTVQKRRELAAETALLIGEPDPMSYLALQHQIGQLVHGRPWTTLRIPKWVARLGAWVQDRLPVGRNAFIKPWMIDLADDHYALDITGAEQTIGWQPRRSLPGTLPRMVEALRANPLAWYRHHDLAPPRWMHQPPRRHRTPEAYHQG